MWHATGMDPSPPGAPPVVPPLGVNVLAILGLPLAMCVPPAGITLGHIARYQIRHTREQGGGLALTALATGYGISVLWAVLIVSALLA